jgi:hypothetical protein
MDLSGEHKQRCERYVIALIEATLPLQRQGAGDPEVTLELLIRAAGMLKEHLEKELEEIRDEQAE